MNEAMKIRFLLKIVISLCIFNQNLVWFLPFLFILIFVLFIKRFIELLLPRRMAFWFCAWVGRWNCICKHLDNGLNELIKSITFIRA